MPPVHQRASAVFLIISAFFAAHASPAAPPAAPVRNVAETFYGVAVDDPYRYLEDVNNAEVTAWMKAHSDHARATLDAIPGWKALFERVREIDEAATAQVRSVRRLPGDVLFYLKRGARDNAFKLYTRKGFAGQEKLLFDPEVLEKATGKPHAINYFRPSQNGRYVAYGVSAAGSEDATLHVLDAASGRPAGKPVSRVRYGGYVSWLPDNRSFFYNRLQKLEAGMPLTERQQKSKVYRYVVGADPEQAKPVLGVGASGIEIEPTDAPAVITTPNSRHAIGMVVHGVQREITLYVAPLSSVGRPDTPWRKIVDVGDGVTQFAVLGDSIFLQTHRGASRFQVLRMSLLRPDTERAEEVVREKAGVITNIAAAKDALYVVWRDGTVKRLERVPYQKGSSAVPVDLPVVGDIGLQSVDARSEGVILSLTNWTRASQIYAFDPRRHQVVNTGLRPVGKFDAPDDVVTTEVRVKSHDGAMVPLSITHKKGIKLDGDNPTLLTGYASYGITNEPNYSAIRLAWFERGGVYAVANPRGSGAFGQEWYKAGYQTTKPNTWKDFIACAEHLIAQGYTSPKKLGILGGSAGGILVGRAMTERPDLFAAVIPAVGVMDMVRVETTPNGVPNIPEFGSVKTEAGFRALYAMSTYHQIRDGTPYPAVLLIHGVNDPRVDPWHSTKAAARLLAASTSGKPVLLRLDYQAGHGVGDTKQQQQEMSADIYAFLLWQLGVAGFQPER
jgi:prolyl oligopeptidase